MNDKCPRCGEELTYDEVDIGVGIQRGNPGCENCHWVPGVPVTAESAGRAPQEPARVRLSHAPDGHIQLAEEKPVGSGGGVPAPVLPSSHDHGNCELCDAIERELTRHQQLYDEAKEERLALKAEAETLQAQQAKRLEEVMKAHDLTEQWKEAYETLQAEHTKILEPTGLRLRVIRQLRQRAERAEAERDTARRDVEALRAALEAASQFIYPEIDRGPAVNGWETTIELVRAALTPAPTEQP